MYGDIMGIKYSVNNNNTTNKGNTVANLVVILKMAFLFRVKKYPINSDPSFLFNTK